MTIKRHGVGPRLGQAVVHGDTVCLAGMVAADPSADAKGPDPADPQEDRRDARGGRQQQVEAPLRHRIRRQHGRLRRHRTPPGDAWIDPANTPARATVEARLASPKYLVEIMSVAAV